MCRPSEAPFIFLFLEVLNNLDIQSNELLQHFQVVTCQNVSELRNFVGADCLTMDIGGSMKYNHLEWVQHRMVSP